MIKARIDIKGMGLSEVRTLLEWLEKRPSPGVYTLHGCDHPVLHVDLDMSGRIVALFWGAASRHAYVDGV